MYESPRYTRKNVDISIFDCLDVFVRTRIHLNHGAIISVTIGFLISPLLVRLFVTDYEMLSSQCVAEYNERCSCADDRGSTVYHLPEEAS